MDRKGHWEAVYRDKTPEEVSWFQPSPAVSMDLIRASRIEAATPLIDLGGGASRLVDNLLEAGFTDLTVLDISGRALERTRKRLGAAARQVHWIEADATAVALPTRYGLWHDRAVFHFLTDAHDRAHYLERLRSHLAPGGTLIIATFAPDGPEMCSGLPVQRYSPENLEETLGPDFKLEETVAEIHTTPGGIRQSFLYGRFTRIA